ncbi:hypothetical protein TNCV_2675661 [Trichonephila clavipes]|nr:hypothetical protein TNCV_2675661 [Trichonephila clavipes]
MTIVDEPRNFEPWSNAEDDTRAADWCLTIADLVHSRKLVPHFSAAPYKRIPITADLWEKQRMEKPSKGKFPFLGELEEIEGRFFDHSQEVKKHSPSLPAGEFSKLKLWLQLQHILFSVPQG